MKNNKKHIDDLFREKLGAYSEVPPSDAWGDLDKRLDILVPHVPTSPFRWLGHVGMVSVIAVLSVSLVQKFIGKNRNESNIVKEQTINKLDNTTSNLAIDNSGAEIKEAAVPAMDNGNDNSDDNSQSGGVGVAGIAQERANGNYTENADQEYIEGVTKINKEQIFDGGNGNADPASYTNSQGKTGNTNRTVNSLYNGNLQGNSTESGTPGTQYNNTVNQSSANDVTVQPQASKSKSALPSAAVKPGSILERTTPNMHRKVDFNRWDAGIKGGYERGFSNSGATKYVIAPYLQFNISPKVAVMIQPAVKYANNPVRVIGAARSYYQVNNDGDVADKGTTTTIEAEGSSVYTYYHTKYRYTQTHDSIVKTEKTASSYMEYELPVLLKYNISKKSSVYGGVNMVYSQMKGVSEYTYTKSGITKTIDSVVSAKSVAPAAPALGDIITYTGTPLSDYNGPLYPATQVNQVRFGATLGFSYEYSDRWLLDALVQQNPAKKDMRAGYNINAPLSSTYFRLSVGYKLTK